MSKDNTTGNRYAMLSIKEEEPNLLGELMNLDVKGDPPQSKVIPKRKVRRTQCKMKI